ncbi:MAG: CHAT domain-containing protein [Acidobacteriaceae bacterium]|nr:CHAT domain-containing protein [Acidobacteriaceae bacterium]
MDEPTEELCLELGKLRDDAHVKALLARYPDLVRTEVVAQLAETVRGVVRVDVGRALSLAEAAVVIARELNDNEALGRALRAKANAVWPNGDCRTAVALFEDAGTHFEQAGNVSEVGRTLSSSLQSYALLGEYESAFTAAGRAREIFRAIGDSPRIARLDINLANIYHRQNRFAEAFAAYERAYRELLPHKDMEAIGVALHNMAVCLIALDDFPRALETYREMRQFCEQQHMPLLVAQADYNIAYLYYLRGDYTRALELLRSTREMCRATGDKYHLSLCDLDQSEIYLELSLIEEAAEMANSSFEHFQELGIRYEAFRSLVNLAIAISLQGDGARASELFAKAKEMAGAEHNQVWPSLIDLYRAVVLLHDNELSEARRLCMAAAKFFVSSDLPSKHVFCLLLLARIQLRTGEFNECAAMCEEALERLNHLDSPILCYEAHLLRGQAQEATGYPEQGYGSYQAARWALETLRTSLQRQELKIGFMRNRLEVYARLTQLCLNRKSVDGKAEEALSYIEAAKACTLRDLILGKTDIRGEEREETETDKKIRELRSELNWYYHRIELEQLSGEATSAKNIKLLRAQAEARERKLLRLIREAPPSSRVVGALRESGAATVNEIRQSLPSGTALLEYFSLADRMFAAVVSADGIALVPLACAASIGQRLRMLDFQFSKFRLDRDYIARFGEPLIRATEAHLTALYEYVFAPLEEWLHVTDLVIVPSGALHSLPFHALFNGCAYAMERFTISYAPSASIYVHARRKQSLQRGPSLILGVDDDRTPFIREEVDAVAAVVPEPEVLLGRDATEQALRTRGCRSRLIHIASHGYFRRDSPMFSAIRLGDSYLNLFDLYHMNLPADLLTLSGCVTGLNAIDAGDELVGLTRGLLYAGARSLLLSLWDVDDRSTAEFMKQFYSKLQAGCRKADALRGAMLQVRERYSHPYYWAPFKLIGDACMSEQ